MKKIVHILIFILNITTIYSQINLVPNFDFEQYSSCPTGQDQIHLATGWSKYNPISFTPDYYNACAPSNGFGVPQSLSLYQEDNRGCSAYAGLVTWNNNGNRELIGSQLSQPLVVGQKYFMSFKTVMGGGTIGGNYFESPSNNIGLKFSTVLYSTSNPAPINNFAHLRSMNIITDTANWILITGSFIVDSTYNYVMLGNFL
ncbi:MAG: hypothetical protein RQ875_03575 [Vicingaceae bacterium]|nr:hypothetical protein [Vicingaceae bacterium]